MQRFPRVCPDPRLALHDYHLLVSESHSLTPFTKERLPKPLPNGDSAMDTRCSKQPRRRLPRTTREDQINAAAMQAFREHGYHGASISQIASSAGLADGALYKFYGSKKEILESVICRWYEGVLESYEVNLKAIKSSEDRLRYALRHNIHCLCEDPNIASLYYELRRDRDFRSSRLVKYNKKYIGILLKILKELREVHSEGGVKLTTISKILYAAIEIGTERFRIHQEPLDQEALTNEILKVARRLI